MEKQPFLAKDGVPVKIKQKRAERVCENILMLAKFIQVHYIQNDMQPDKNLVNQIYELYGKVLDVYLVSANEPVSDEIFEEYKKLAGRLKKAIDEDSHTNEVK